MTSTSPIVPPCSCGKPDCKIPFGLCHCGCGRKTSISTENRPRYGIKRGDPQRFIVGHHKYLRIIREEEEPFEVDGVLCRHIPVSGGYKAIVDAADYEWLMQWRWNSLASKNRTVYVQRNLPREDKTRGTISMHRQIAATPEKPQVDHINHNGLDNRRKNLRPCTVLENARNSSVRKCNKFGIKGIVYANGTYGFTLHCRGFKTVEEAAEARWKIIQELHGEFASQ